MGDRIGVQFSVRGIYLGLTNHPGQLSLVIPLWVGTINTGQRAVILCGWRVKTAGTARVWRQVKLSDLV